MRAAQSRQPQVLIEGDGIAAVCVARLLTDAGVSCAIESKARPKLAAILLGEQTQRLLRDLFAANGSADDLFAGFVAVNRRVVLWGENPTPMELPHLGVVAPEAELLRRLWGRVPALPVFDTADLPPSCWRVQTSRAGMSAPEERSFGDREARFSQVELSSHAEAEACWVESVEDGWLFLLSLGDGCGSLIAVGAEVQAMLAESRLVASRVARISARGPAMPSYPRLLRPFVQERMIACGAAAMSFDPLCGEGAGNAVREAFLAAAVVRSALRGEMRDLLGSHYASRLTQGFLRHLQVCLQFYDTGGDGHFWKRESEALRHGIAELQAELACAQPARLILRDRDLVPF